MSGELSAAQQRAARDELIAFCALPVPPGCAPFAVLGLPLPARLVMVMPDGKRRPIDGFWLLERESLEGALRRLAGELGAVSVELVP